MADTSLHTKYRPDAWGDVIGQSAIVKSLMSAVERDDVHAFLFCGPSGCGKTTLARIVADQAQCTPADIIEIDAATHSGVEEMRKVVETLQYKPFGKSKSKAIIIDECHTLSKNAWQALLKATEEPPAHVYWFLCTTEPGKVPATIKTRFAQYTVKSLNDKELAKLFDYVCGEEDIDVPEDIANLIIKEANGSARQLLVNLAVCRDVTNKKEAAELLKSAAGNAEINELCRFLLSGGSWIKAMSIVAKLAEESPESVRIVICNYMAAVARNAKTDKAACQALAILEAFAEPYNASENMAPLMLSLGRVLFSD